MNRFSCFLTSALLVAIPTVGLCADMFTGQVYDLGVTNPGARGIPGVNVVVKDAKDQTIGNGITDGKGNYSFPLRAAPGNQSSARYEKIGYFAYPTIRPVVSLNGPQPAVPLSKGSASAEYYKQLAENFARASGDPSGTAMRADFVTAVAGLPSIDKAKAREYLVASAPSPVLADFNAADKAFQSYIDFSEALQSGGSAYRFVKAYPNYPKVGSVLLYGSVADPNSAKEAEKLVRSFGGVTAVKNDLRIEAK